MVEMQRSWLTYAVTRDASWPQSPQSLRQHKATCALCAKITGHLNSGSSPLLSVNHARKERGGTALGAHKPKGYCVKKTRYRRCRSNCHIRGNPTEPPKDSGFSTTMAKIQPIYKNLVRRDATLGDHIQQTQQNSTDKEQTQTWPKQAPKRAKMPLKGQKRRS